MASVLEHLSQSYQHHTQLREARLASGQQPHLPLTSPEFIFWANVGYLSVNFILWRFMVWRGRPFQCKPFKTILGIYNLSCVFLAAYVVYGILYILLLRPFRFVCNDTLLPGQDGDTGHAEYMAHVFWIFYIQKFWEFFDTWFFLLRMSFRQVTFLHVFHHATINMYVGLTLPYEFSGDMYLPILLNAFVHTLMYSHYLATIMKVKAPWRPFLTSLQLTQFVLIAIQSSMGLYYGDTCGAPFFSKITLVLYMGSMLILFGNFFIKAYVVKKPNARFGDGVVMRMEPIKHTKVHTGRVLLDDNGSALVELPKANPDNELSYQVTPIGKPMPELHVSREPSVEKRSFELSGGAAGCCVSWTVGEEAYILGQQPKKQAEACPLTALACCGGSGNPQGSDATPCCGANEGVVSEKKGQ